MCMIFGGKKTINELYFTFSAASMVPGVFSQNLCKVMLYSEAVLVLSETIACEAGMLNEWEIARVASGALQLPAHPLPNYNVSIQFISSAGLLNGEFATTLWCSAGALYFGIWFLLS